MWTDTGNLKSLTVLHQRLSIGRHTLELNQFVKMFAARTHTAPRSSVVTAALTKVGF